MTPEELQARIEQLRAQRSSAQPQTEAQQTPVPQAEQAPVAAAPTAISSFDQISSSMQSSVPQATPSAASSSTPTQGVSSFDQIRQSIGSGETSSPETTAEAMTDLKDKKELSAEDIVNLPFEEIVKLADINSPLEYSAKKQLADALRGSTSTNPISEFFIGTPFQQDEMEDILEDKYQEFITANPDKARNWLQRAASGLMTGSVVNNLVDENSQTVLPESAAQINSLGNAVTGEFGDELFGALGMDSTQRAIRASNQQLNENEIVGDAILTDIAGAVIPASAGARALGIGAQGVSTVGNVLRTGALGAAEGAVTAAGATDDGSAADRATAAAGGAAIGGTIGLLGEPAVRAAGAAGGVLKRFVSSSSREANAARGAVDDIVKVAARLDGVQPITADEIIEGLEAGVPISRQLIRKGMRPDQVSETINDLSGGSRRILNEMHNMAEELTSGQMARLDDELVATGRALEAARLSSEGGVTPDGISRIIRDVSGMEQGTVFVEDILRPTVRNLVRDNRTLARAAGYGNDSSKASRNIFINEEDGTMFIVRQTNGKPARVDPETGQYKEEDLYEIVPSGTFIQELESVSRQVADPNLRAGSPVNQVRGYGSLEPITDRLGTLEREVSPRVAQNSDANASVRRQQEAVRGGSARGGEGYRDYVAELERGLGPRSSMSATERESLEHIAKEASALQNVGRRASASDIQGSFLSGLISDVRLAGVFSGSLAGMARIVTTNSIYRAMRNAFNVGSKTDFSRAERAIMPAIEALVRTSDDELVKALSQAVRSGATTDQAIVDVMSRALPAVGSAVSAATATPHVTGDQQRLLGEID